MRMISLNGFDMFTFDSTFEKITFILYLLVILLSCTWGYSKSGIEGIFVIISVSLISTYVGVVVNRE